MKNIRPGKTSCNKSSISFLLAGCKYYNNKFLRRQAFQKPEKSKT
jgi:hypothetical protein